MPDLADCQAGVIAEFEGMDGMATYLRLVETARGVPSWPEADKREEYLLPGCQAEVWMRAELLDGRLWFHVDSPSLIIKGIAVLLARVLSGQPPATVRDAELHFVQEIGLADHLSPDRANGLHAMLGHMRRLAAEVA